jgi:four helix bundle protein
MGNEETGNGQRATGNGQRALGAGGDIAERLLKLALAAIRVAGRLPREVAARHVASQLVRSATGGGANYEEARAAESRNDFIHKNGIAAKEVRETVFWLTLIQRSGWARSDLGMLPGEAMELAAILAASAQTARRNSG